MAIGLKLKYASATADVVGATPGIIVTPLGDRDSWESRLRHAVRPHFAQSWCHGEGRRAEGWRVERLLFAEGEEPLALCQVLWKRPLGMPIARIEHGPSFLHETMPAELQLAVLRAVRRRWRFGLHGLLLLSPALPQGEQSVRLLREAGFWQREARGASATVIDLRLPLDETHRQLTSDWRTRIRRARRFGISLRLRRDAAAVDWLLDRAPEERQAGVPAARSPDFYREAFAASPRDFCLLQAMVNGEPEAGILLGRSGQHSSRLLSWSRKGTRQATAVSFLLWNTIIEMQRAGCQTLDLGADAPRGVGGTPVRFAGEWLAL
ncbi:MAG TPA: GNAT family N-acetyltransferase [Steroidobacteraceae bacterium]